MKIFYLISFLCLLCVGCSQNTQHSSLSYPFSANILFMNDMKVEQKPYESPTYTFSHQEFKFLTDLQNLDGRYFKLYRGGVIGISNNSMMMTGQKNPHLNYKIIDHVIIPKDYSSIAMLSAYYQFDFIAQKLKTMTDFDIADIVNSYGKIEIFFEPKFTQETGGFIRDEFPKQNAAYFPNFHKFVLYSRARIEQVPLSMNLQVISHEFGHGIWEFTFDNGLAKSCDRLNAEYSISGLNEGFADFFSYTLTGSTNILENSFHIKSISRMRNFSLTNFNYAQIAEIADENNSICNQSYYCIGVLFANALFKTQKILGYEVSNFEGEKSRSDFLKKIVFALQKTKSRIRNLPSLPNSFNECINHNETNSMYNGMILGAFFYAFLNQIDDINIKFVLHCALVENFGNRGFPPEFRLGMCI